MILALFFTRGVSLKTWLDTGLFDREKLLYETHLNNGHFERVYWLTYGINDVEISRHLKAKGRLHPNIDVIAMPRTFKTKMGRLIYSFLVPAVQSAHLKRADIYKTNQMDGSWSAVLSKFIFGKPLVVRTGYTLSVFAQKACDSKLRILIYQLIEWLAYKSADRAILASRKDHDYITEAYGCASQKLVVIPNYINTDLFKPRQRKRYTNRIVFVGRLNRQKNLYNLIAAVAKIDFCLDIYGGGELQAPLEAHAKKVGARVSFRGVVPNLELPNILNNYKYFVIPSLYEGMPKTLLEAMACGCICVGTDVDGTNEIITNEFNGFLSKGTDADSIGQALRMAVSNHNDHIAHHAVATIQERFALRAVAQRDRVVCT